MPRGRYYKKPTKRAKHRINRRITAPEVRLIGADDKQVGIMSSQDALQKAHAANLDLVEIAPKAKPPVVKIIDYNKFQYREAKKLNQQKKAAKKSELKEVRFKLYMEEADYQVRVRRVRKFIKAGNQVRLTIPFYGRQLAHKDQGYQFMDKLFHDLGEIIKVDTSPKFIGRKIIATISPNPTSNK